MDKHKVKVGISVGDINGIGLEVILKTLSDERIVNHLTPIIYGSTKVVSYHRNIVGVDIEHFQSIRGVEQLNMNTVNVVNCWQENVNIRLGKMTPESGDYAILSLDKATEDLKMGLIDALVTAPINKKAMKNAQFPYQGHTEYLAEAFNVKESLMLLVNGNLRIAVATNHLPIKEVSKVLTKELVETKIKIFDETLKIDFGIDRPTIAVLGLNPHAGDEGVIGLEEENVIQPAVAELKKKGVMVIGPYSADGFFGSGQYAKFDGILAMYHDQGLIPFKTLSFGQGVNYTAGLPIVRTSPDHGTAYDIAGKNIADPDSFRRALFLATDIVSNRLDYMEAHANPLKKRAKEVLAEEFARGGDGVIKEEEKQPKKEERRVSYTKKAKSSEVTENAKVKEE